MSEQQIERCYNYLINGEIDYFFVSDSVPRDQYNIHIYSGSFNPLHEVHRLIADSMLWHANCNSTAPTLAFELSLARRDKEFLSLKELTSRLEQFNSDDLVIVTNAKTFLEKAGALIGRKITFHIGYDTAVRILEDEGRLGVQGINAEFVVYARDGIGLESIIDPPENFSEGTHCREYIGGVSSTKLRNMELEVDYSKQSSCDVA